MNASRRAFLGGLATLAQVLAALRVEAAPPFAKRGKGNAPPTVITFTGVSISLATFSAPITDGTAIGDITVQSTGGAINPTLALSGADAGSFRLSSATLPSQLLADGTVNAGTYADVKVAPTEAGVVNSGVAFQIGPIVGTDAPADETVVTFQASEVNSAASKGLFRFGHIFPQGAVESGKIIHAQSDDTDVATQVDAVSTWPDGSLRECVVKCRDTDFTSGLTRTYTLVKRDGTYDNDSDITLADVTSETDFLLDFTSISGSISGPISNVTGISFNTLSATATRVTKYEQGPVCDSWEVWGQGIDGTHKVEYYITRWKEANGDLIDYEVGAVLCMDWWSVPNKQTLTYTCALKNGVTTIQSYAGVQHLYRSQWFTARMTDDHQHSKRHWLTACPSLQVKPDRAYWTQADMPFPPMDPSQTSWSNPYNNAAGKTYTPGSSQSHRAFIDGTGAFPGLGALTNPDCIAFLSQGALDARIARVNAFAGLHIPYHYRSNEDRARPAITEPFVMWDDGGATDTANTVMPFIIQDERGVSTPSSFYDFTAAGMPTPTHASANTLSNAANKGGYTNPPSATTSGSTAWILSIDATHAAAYSYYMYLAEGERYFMKATLDLAFNCAHQRADVAFGYMGQLPSRLVYGTGSTAVWCPTVIGWNQGQNDRGTGWGARQIGVASAAVPDADVQAGTVRLFASNNAKFLSTAWALMPATQRAAGGYVGYLNNTTSAAGVTIGSPWMEDFIVIGAYMYGACTGDTQLDTFCAEMGNNVVGRVDSGIGLLGMYHGALILNCRATYNASTNPWHAADEQFYGDTNNPQSSLSGDTFTVNLNDKYHGLTLTLNDEMILPGKSAQGTEYTKPAEMSYGVPVYIRDINQTNMAAATFKVAATPGGAALTLTGASASQAVLIRPQSAAAITNMRTQMVGVNANDFQPIGRCALICAHLRGNAGATQGKVDQAQSVLATPAPADGTTWATWSWADPG